MTALPAPLAAALDEKGYGALTSVQAAVLDAALAGRDLLVSAQTGSGKTVAFGLAMAEALLGAEASLPPPDTPRALIVAPTRELALQVRRELEWLYEKAGATIASCVGGMDIRTERRALERGAHIVVGTPGRLRDHLERASLDPALIATVVLDEADEMLDLGFREDLEFILSSLPAERRTLMFSATVSPGIERLAGTFQRDAERVATTDAREAHADIAYRAMLVAPQDAENAIVNVLRHFEARNALVFCKTRATVNHLTARLLNRGFAVVPLSGELAQDERARALQAMRDGRARVCVATDVAARGIDLPGLELVIHADLPSNAETLLHRSGRTGRAGRKGTSALIVPMRARRRTERLLAEAGIAADWGPAPSAADVAARDTERLFTDPALGAPETAEEHALITALIERFTPRELAAGVMRQYFAARSAPEDIDTVADEAPKPRDRTAFDRSIWLRLGVGRTARAEPRWLLPMLCRAGDLTRDDIGAIRIFEDETLVQIHADAEARFFNALGEGGRLERDITVDRSAPPSADARPGPRAGPRADTRADTRPPRSGPRAERPKSDRPKPDRPRPERPRGEQPRADAPPSRESRTDRPRRDAPPRDADRPQNARAERKPDRPRDADSDRPDRAPRPRRDLGDRTDRAPRPYREDGGTSGPPRRDEGDQPRPARASGPASARSGERFERSGPRPDRPPHKPRESGKPSRERSGDRNQSRPPRDEGKGADRPRGGGTKYAPKGKPGPGAKPARSGPPAAPVRPDRSAALDPSARLTRPGAKPRGGKPAKGGAPGRGPRGKPSGPRDGNTPPFRPRRG